MTTTFRAASFALLPVLLAMPARSQPAELPDALSALNDEFRSSYADAKALALARLDPVIEVYEGDKLLLVRCGVRTEAAFSLPSDARLKAVAHASLGVFTALRAWEAKPITADAQARLQRYRERLRAARAALSSSEFDAAALTRQQKLLDATGAALSSAIDGGRVDAAALGAFARQAAPLLLENVADSAHAQLDRIHARVTLWRREMTADEWARLRVVVMGVHMARDGELATQYFERLLGETEEGGRIVYAEGIWDEAGALDLAATHLLDGEIGTAFFGQGRRMHRDVFADAARAHLDALGVCP
jgi:hypothetical protein